MFCLVNLNEDIHSSRRMSFPKNKTLFIILFLFIVTVTFCVGCGKDANSSASQTLRIGLVAAQTGPDGQFGSKMLSGAQIAIEEQNERGGVLGKKIEMIIRDDEGKPNQAVAVAHELVSQGVAAVLGHFNSGCSIPASSIYAESKVLQISPGSSNPELTEKGIQTVFRVVGRDDQIGEVCAEFAYNTLGLRKIAILHNKTAYGQGVAEEFKKNFEKAGGAVLVYDGISSEEVDFRANVSLIQSKHADGLFWGGMYAQGGPLFNQLRQAGLNIPFLAGDGTFEQEFVNTVGGKAEHVYLSYGTDYASLETTRPFLEKYRAKFGQEGPYSVYGYVAAQVLFQAIEKAGTADADQVANTLRSMTFDTALGPAEFNSKGDLKKMNYIIWTIQNGKLVPYEKPVTAGS